MKFLKIIETKGDHILNGLNPPYFQLRSLLFTFSVLANSAFQLGGNKDLMSDYYFKALQQSHIYTSSEAFFYGIGNALGSFSGEFIAMMAITSICTIISWFFYENKERSTHPIVYFKRSLLIFIPIYLIIELIQAINLITNTSYVRKERLELFAIFYITILSSFILVYYIVESYKLMKNKSK